MKLNLFALRIALASFLICTTISARAQAEGKERVVATDYPSLQAAVDALPNKRGEVYLPAGNYNLDKTLNLSQGGDNGGGTVLTGAGLATVITGVTKGQPIIDMTGASSCVLQNLTINSAMTPADAPNVGVLLARYKGGGAQENKFLNVNFNGYCKLANVYNLSSELDRFTDCTFTNWAPGADNIAFCQENYGGVASPYLGDLAGNSTTELRVEGCIFYDYGPAGPAQPGIHEMNAGGANVRIEGNASDVTIRDSYMCPPAGGYAISLGRASWGAQVERVFLDGLRIEGDRGADSPKAIIQSAYWVLPGAKPPYGAIVNGKPNALSPQTGTVVIRDCCIYSGPKTVAINAGVAHYWQIENNDFFSHAGQPVITAEALMYSSLERNKFNWDGNEDVAAPAGSVAVSANRAVGSDIQAPSRSQVVIANLSGTTIDALNEGGKRHIYTSDMIIDNAPNPK